MALKAERATGAVLSGWPKLGAAGSRPGPGDVDESFDRSMAAFSRQLAARLANNAPGPVTEPEEDPAAPADELQAPEWSEDIPQPRPEPPEDPAPWSQRPHLLVLAFGIGAIAAAGGLYLLDSPSTPAAPSPPPPELAAPAVVVPAPPPAVQPPPTAIPLTLPPAEGAAEASIETPPPQPSPRDTGALGRDEVREVQTHLNALGFAPGPLDGVAGPRTVAAIRRYEESVGQPPTGQLDRETLKLLREAARP